MRFCSCSLWSYLNFFDIFPPGWGMLRKSRLLLLIHTFSVLSLQQKKLRWHNKSAIDLSNTNPACGHQEVRRSTGNIMVTTRYLYQQGSKSRQKVMRLYKQWHRPISKRFIKPPSCISRATSIDSECCRLPTTSVLSKKTEKLRSSQSKFLKATHCTKIRKIEIPRSMVVEALSWWSWRASQHPAVQSPVHPGKSPTNLARSPLLVALVGRKMTVVRHQLFLRNLPVQACDSRAQRFSPPLARRRSSRPPPSPNLVRTHPIEHYQALRDRVLCLSRAATLPKGTNWGSEEARTSD